MYICICNAIKEADFRRAAREHPGDVEEVYAAMGYEPQCAQCVDPARAVLVKVRQEMIAQGI